MSDGKTNVDRALGRIEGLVEQILKEQKSMRDDFGNHRDEDQAVASSLRALIYKERDDVAVQFAALKTARAVLRGQLTMGQKVVTSLGALVLFLLTVWEALKNIKH